MSPWPAAPGNSDIVTFRAAHAWSCSHAAWLPAEAAAPRTDLLRVASRWAERSCGPRLRADVLRAMAEDRVLVQAVEDDGLFGIETGERPRARRSGGTIVEVHVLGTLDERMLPLWVSRAIARALADELSGRLLAPMPALGAATHLPDVISGETPPFALVEHVLVLSAANARGRGALTTQGMGRLGLPEIEVRNVPHLALAAMAAAVNGIAWRVLDATLGTPPEPEGDRVVRMPSELRLERAWIRAALGPRSAVRLPPAGDGDARVRLRMRLGPGCAEWLQVDPPTDWRAGRKAWARSIADALGLPWAPPADLAPRRGRDD